MLFKYIYNTYFSVFLSTFILYHSFIAKINYILSCILEQFQDIYKRNNIILSTVIFSKRE